MIPLLMVRLSGTHQPNTSLTFFHNEIGRPGTGQ